MMREMLGMLREIGRYNAWRTRSLKALDESIEVSGHIGEHEAVLLASRVAVDLVRRHIVVVRPAFYLVPGGRWMRGESDQLFHETTELESRRALATHDEAALQGCVVSFWEVLSWSMWAQSVLTCRLARFAGVPISSLEPAAITHAHNEVVFEQQLYEARKGFWSSAMMLEAVRWCLNRAGGSLNRDTRFTTRGLVVREERFGVALSDAVDEDDRSRDP